MHAPAPVMIALPRLPHRRYSHIESPPRPATGASDPRRGPRLRTPLSTYSAIRSSPACSSSRRGVPTRAVLHAFYSPTGPVGHDANISDALDPPFADAARVQLELEAEGEPPAGARAGGRGRPGGDRRIRG